MDAYQGPYKDRFYYWTGLQLLMRAVFFGLSSLNRNVNLTVSIILFGILGGLHGIIQPLKVKYKNYQELILVFNLQALYTILLYSQGTKNLTIVNLLFGMVIIQFTFISLYHIIIYMFGRTTINKIQLRFNAFIKWFIRLQKKSQPQQFRLQDNIRDKIPEVAFNYHEYREP